MRYSASPTTAAETRCCMRTNSTTAPMVAYAKISSQAIRCRCGAAGGCSSTGTGTRFVLISEQCKAGEGGRISGLQGVVRTVSWYEADGIGKKELKFKRPVGGR